MEGQLVKSAINRRIARRMVALNIEYYEDYVEYCREHDAEVDALYRLAAAGVRAPTPYGCFDGVLLRQ